MPGPADYIDSEVARYRREMEEALDAIERKIARALKEAHVDGDGRLVRDAFNLELLRRTGDAVAAELGDAVSEVRERFRRSVEELVRRVGGELADVGLGAEFTTLSADSLRHQRGSVLDDLIDSATRDLRNVSPDLRDVLRSVTTKMLRTPVSPDAAVEKLAGKVGASVAATLSLVDTTLAGTDRAVTLDQATQAGVRYFVLAGPVDSLTRPWCKARVGYRFTVEQMDATPSDAGPQPPSIHAGGWLCRHRWEALVTEEEVAAVPVWPG